MDDIVTRQNALEHIMATDKEFLTPAEVAPVLGVAPHSIRITARHHPESLKFELVVIGNRTKIPRIPFLRFIGVNVNNLATTEKPQAVRSTYDVTPMTNEELLLAVTQQIHALKKELDERFDIVERQIQDSNNILQAARTFINALVGNARNN